MRSSFLYSILAMSLIFYSCEQKEKIDLQIPYLFSDHMVLQQNEKVSIWGQYNPNDKIEIKGSWGEKAITQTDENGDWNLKIQTPKAGGPFTMNITTADSTIVLNDILFGEVWLASGQSNMQMPLKGWPPNDVIKDSKNEIASAAHPEIRMFTVPMTLSLVPLDDIKGEWLASSPETAGDFSATAYFFAKRLQEELKVPIGIIHSSWGGTPAESWASEASLRKLGDFDDALDLVKDPKTFEVVDNWFGQFPAQDFPETKEQWEQMDFADIDAAKPEFDDSNWTNIEIPGPIDLMKNGAFDGAVWIRKEFEISDTSSDYLLHIGAIDDMDATYINGEKVGGLVGNGFWNVPREMTVPKNLLKKGQNSIAIRIIDTGGGGSVDGPVELKNKDGKTINLAGTWKYLVIAEIYLGKFYGYGLKNSIESRPEVMQLNPYIPSVLYNAMINPLVPYSIKGAIWYQGESNVGRDAQYRRLFPTMINDWREKWQVEFPFYFVQIAPYNYSPDPASHVSQKLREAQRQTLSTPKTGMVVTLDIGDVTNIHPANKQDVGSRLAGLALANDYGKELMPSGPLYKSMSITGNKIVLEFDYAMNGLMAGEDGLSGFEIAGEDKVFSKAAASIVNNTIVLTASGIDTPLHARYAWRDNSTASLFNAEGLPASSFSTKN
ncbi:sialate O-acetylesterase [Lutimonas halocynthiae]|uniref:sialate O-acetylesterase n=1 Tax=Lutimonas halocynthiae TaxID=1446477 RepID=UPI0025B3B667|nr:sialate O-acetylesterase [Lutimonas halocynthiae]MDN3641138.1 sialate O-acetylesterase [Lutimonas halocynthiae]